MVAAAAVELEAADEAALGKDGEVVVASDDEDSLAGSLLTNSDLEASPADVAGDPDRVEGGSGIAGDRVAGLG